MDELRALALWCLSLPELRGRAIEGGWLPRLERAAERVRSGRSALAACERFGLIDPATDPQDPPTTRGGAGSPNPLPLRGIGAVPPVGRGSYRCPRQRCPRGGERDDQGRPPLCGLFDEPMLPNP